MDRYQKENLNRRTKAAKVRNIAFLAVLVILAAIGLDVAARPRTSTVEKRDLAVFPHVSAAGLWNGQFFTDLSTWYADTYPLRESMISAQARLENVYGIRTQKLIVNNAGTTADAIPDAEDVGAAGLMEIPSGSDAQDENENGTAADAVDEKGSAQDGDASGNTDNPSGSTAAEEDDTSDGSSAGNHSDGTSADASDSSEEGTAAQEDEGSDEDHNGGGAITAQPEAVGSIYIADGCGFGVYYFNQSAVDSYASMVNTAAARLGSGVQVYAIPAPDNFGIMLDRSIQESLSQYEGDAFTYLYKRFGSNVQVIKTFQTLEEHNAEYVYFHTDHHWTALGAYYAYEQFCKAKGWQPHEISQFEEQVSENFLGSFYSYSNHSPELAANPDTIHAYIPMSTNNMKMMMHDGTVMDYLIIQPGSTYDVFIGSDEPWEEIDNPDINDGSSCVVIKDSYGNAFVPWLVDHYDKVFVIDFRYYTQDLSQLIQDEDIDDVIFLNNIEFLSTDNSSKILSLFRFENH